jgi:hypothetical protein
MASLFPKIYDVIDHNPHKNTTLRWCEPTSTEGSSHETWDTFTAQPLNPPGALSILLLKADPMYELGSLALRKQILTEHLLQLHERVDKELIGRRFPRKKIQDLLAGQISAQSPTPSALLEEVLCELFHIQKIKLNRRTKSISCFPPDLRLWRADRPILFSDDENCWKFTPIQQESFLTWLLNKEEEGWALPWPTADGRMEEIKAALQHQNSIPEGKHKKDELASILGRKQAISILSELRLSTC